MIILETSIMEPAQPMRYGGEQCYISKPFCREFFLDEEEEKAKQIYEQMKAYYDSNNTDRVTYRVEYITSPSIEL